MGLSRRRRSLRVELPLALPSILAGIRIATVTTISLATVAAFILPTASASRSSTACATFFKTKFIAAGALAVGLALVVDAALVLVGRLLTPWARARRAT